MCIEDLDAHGSIRTGSQSALFCGTDLAERETCGSSASQCLVPIARCVVLRLRAALMATLLALRWSCPPAARCLRE